MKASKYFLLAWLTILLGTLLRFFMLTDKSLWYDEGQSLNYADSSNFQEIITKLVTTKTGDRFQPLYYLVLFCWRHMFGNTEFALRSLSAFLGVGAVLVLFYTVLPLYGKKHAFWSVLLVSISSYAVYYSQQVRPYALLLFLASLQLYFFSKALNEREERDEIVSRCFFWIITAFSLFCSTLIALFSTALCLSHILVYRNLQRWLKWWIPAAILGLPAILFYLSSPSANDPTKVLVTPVRQSIIQNIFFVLYGLLVGETYGPPIEGLRGINKVQVLFSYWPHLLILFFVVATIFIFLLMDLYKQPERKRYYHIDYFFASLFALSLMIGFLFALLTKYNWLPRHSFYIYLPLIILIPSIIRNRARKTRKFPGRLQYARLAIIALAILNIYSISNYYFNNNYDRENYRLAAQYLMAHRGPDVECVLLFGSLHLLSYYGDTVTLEGADLEKDLTNFAENVSKLTHDAKTVIIAVNYKLLWESTHKISVENAMSNLYILQSKASFTNFNMYHFVKKQ